MGSRGPSARANADCERARVRRPESDAEVRRFWLAVLDGWIVASDTPSRCGQLNQLEILDGTPLGLDSCHFELIGPPLRGSVLRPGRHGRNNLSLLTGLIGREKIYANFRENSAQILNVIVPSRDFRLF
jgi:hypothetical protein